MKWTGSPAKLLFTVVIMSLASITASFNELLSLIFQLNGVILALEVYMKHRNDADVTVMA